jgi:hypothetical protein
MPFSCGTKYSKIVMLGFISGSPSDNLGGSTVPLLINQWLHWRHLFLNSSRRTLDTFLLFKVSSRFISIHRFHGQPPSWFLIAAHAHSAGAWWAISWCLVGKMHCKQCILPTRHQLNALRNQDGGRLWKRWMRDQDFHCFETKAPYDIQDASIAIDFIDNCLIIFFVQNN